MDTGAQTRTNMRWDFCRPNGSTVRTVSAERVVVEEQLFHFVLKPRVNCVVSSCLFKRCVLENKNPQGSADVRDA